MEKMELIGGQFSDDSLEMIRRFKALFDPTCRLNPVKMLSTGKRCKEIQRSVVEQYPTRCRISEIVAWAEARLMDRPGGLF